MVKQTRTAVKQQREPRATKSQRSAGGAPVPATAYTSADLVARAQSLLDAFDLDAARRFAERALEVDDACVEAVELLGVCALELGDVEGAKEHFERGLELAPNAISGLLNLGQMHGGHEALAYYQRAIDVLNEGGMHDQSSTAKLSSVYCAMAELYLTDLCDEADAEQRCEELVERALSFDARNAEALQTRCSLRLSQGRVEEARESVRASVGLWLPRRFMNVEDADTELELDADADADVAMDMDEDADENEVKAVDTAENTTTDTLPPPYAVRLSTVKLLLELQEYTLALTILGGLQQEDDEVVETWHLYAMTYWCLGAQHVASTTTVEGQECDDDETAVVERYLAAVVGGERTLDADVAEHWDAARECADEALKLITRGLCEDEMLVEQVRALHGTLKDVTTGEEDAIQG